MSSLHRFAIGVFLFILAAAQLLSSAFNRAIEGEIGPIGHAYVGWQGERSRIKTDANGRFRVPMSMRTRRLIAHHNGFRIASSLVTEGRASLNLARLPSEDNPDYQWIDPNPDGAKVDNCANCHAEIYGEWRTSAHAKSATNARFLSLFAGGHKTWNARVENPDGAGVCAGCHVPTLRSPTLEYDVREADGVHKSGIHCDFCHKIADVPAGKFGTRFGRDGIDLLRPFDGDSLTFGPLDDAVRRGESFAVRPVYKESRYCASCHEGVVFGVHAYGTYSEWLESPAKARGKQCQDCHMTPTGRMRNIAPGKGGIERDPRTLASHHTPGGQHEMLKQSLEMKVSSSGSPRGRLVEIDITAKNVGHRVPTGFADRQVILVVRATDANGKQLDLLDGPQLPASVGKWAGGAGSLFAKQLFDERGRSPLPFWLPIDKVEDTRLFPERTERRSFLFPASTASVTAQLWYRRFWQEVADMRGWQDNDLLIVEQSK